MARTGPVCLCVMLVTMVMILMTSHGRNADAVSIVKKIDDSPKERGQGRSSALPAVFKQKRVHRKHWQAFDQAIPNAIDGTSDGKTHVGSHLMQICTQTTCGNKYKKVHAVRKAVQRALGIKAGQTTSDGLITLWGDTCGEPCDNTPPDVIMDGKHYEIRRPKDVERIIQDVRMGRDPAARPRWLVNHSSLSEAL
ncbi:putative NADH dehydrogenase [ubiquinone] flavoprotein 2, mitochondrial [Branchiostoma floridae x Branchiostoma japonicum]